MTSRIFKSSLLAIALCLLTVAGIHAQEPEMSRLIGQSLSKLKNPSPHAFLTCIAELKRIDAMYPDSIQPKFQMALQSLSYSVMNPQDKQVENLLAESQQTIDRMKQLKGADFSNIHTLQGFLYMVRIVQNPAVNGQRYYLEVMENFEKALKIDPDNALAKNLQQKFTEGMRQSQNRQ